MPLRDYRFVAKELIVCECPIENVQWVVIAEIIVLMVSVVRDEVVEVLGHTLVEQVALTVMTRLVLDLDDTLLTIGFKVPGEYPAATCSMRVMRLIGVDKLDKIFALGLMEGADGTLVDLKIYPFSF